MKMRTLLPTALTGFAIMLTAGSYAANNTLTPDIEFAALSRAAGPLVIAQATPPAPVASAVAGADAAAPAAEPKTAAVATTDEKKPPAVLPDANTNTAAASAESVTAPKGDQPETIPVSTAAPASKENLISVALDDVPLQDVVRMFTRISGANIIATSTNLQGKVTVNLENVEWKPALSSILDIYNLTIFEKIPGSGIYSVVSKPPGAAEPMIAQTIILNYAAVDKVVSIVNTMVDKGGSVAPFPNANALVVRTSAANMNEIRKVVAEIDLPRKQVYIEAKFLELTDEAIKDLGINWQVLEGYSIGAKNLQVGLQENRDKVKNRADTLTRSDVRTRTDTINDRYDSTGARYDETTAITEEQPPGSGNFVTRSVVTPNRSVSDTIGQSTAAGRTLEDSFKKTATDIRTAVLSADDFAIILSALKQMNGVSIVSNPKIVVANEETATIHIGENEPNIKGTVTAGQQGQANTTTYALDEARPYFEFGISVDVTPTINNDSNITVRINPKLSRFVRDKVAPDQNTFPVESTKTIKTVFSLESGKTAAIGGLTETDERDVTKKIPLLGDIPLLGKYLFSHTHKSTSQKETIIFVTVAMAYPTQIRKEEGLPEDSRLVHQLLKAKALSNGQTAPTP